MPNVYTNRALVNLKMSRFAEAEADATGKYFKICFIIIFLLLFE